MRGGRSTRQLNGSRRVSRPFATRNSTLPPSLLQGLAACAACGYGYYRTSARTARTNWVSRTHRP